MQTREHWERVYSTKAVDQVSWFQPHADVSLRLIRDSGLPLTASIIDCGGGASTLVDDLLARGFHEPTVLDISGAALAKARSRLGDRALDALWREGDVLDAELPAHAYDLWHDRALFHFLTSPEDRRAYLRAVGHALKPGGLVIVATFAEDGPTKCSGLPVVRYGADRLQAEFGERFALLAQEAESHHTPGGNEQKFIYCLFRACQVDPQPRRADKK